jgi:hypothetical protein
LNAWSATGLHVDGDVADFMGQSLSTKYSIDGAPPEHPCGLILHLSNGMIFKAEDRDMIGHRPHGLELGCVLHALPHFRHGLEFGHGTRRPGAGGMEFGVRFRAAQHDSQGIEFGYLLRESLHSPCGIEFGNVLVDLVYRTRDGIEFGSLSAEDTSHFANGVEFAYDSHAVPVSPPRDTLGIEMADVHRGVTPPPDRVSNGIEMACTFRIPDPPPPPLPSTCASSISLMANTLYSYNSVSGLDLFFKFPLPSGMVGRFDFTPGTGTVDIDIYNGPCPGGPGTGATMHGGCRTVTGDSGGWIYVNIRASAAGKTGVLELTQGSSCP